MEKHVFIAGVLARAKELREAGLLGKRSVRPTVSTGKKRGRPPKPAEPEDNGLLDAFDEIEEPLDSELSDQ